MKPDEIAPRYNPNINEAIFIYIDEEKEKFVDFSRLFNSSNSHEQYNQFKDIASILDDYELEHVKCTFLCISLPATIPNWITNEPRIVEEGFYCIVNWQHPDLKKILVQEFDPSALLKEHLLKLGFKYITEIRWFCGNL